MIVTPYKSFGSQDGIEMVSLIDPDNGGFFGLRYVWITHETNNENFIGNYFSSSSLPGVNIRKSTINLQPFWDIHNKVFTESANNGDLVWRVKVLNNISKSIDYIEIWKNRQMVINFFGPDNVFPGNRLNVLSVPEWTNEVANCLGEGIFRDGFIVRNWYPPQTVSYSQAKELYEKFYHKSKNKDNCIINTPWTNTI